MLRNPENTSRARRRTSLSPNCFEYYEQYNVIRPDYAGYYSGRRHSDDCQVYKRTNGAGGKILNAFVREEFPKLDAAAKPSLIKISKPLLKLNLSRCTWSLECICDFDSCRKIHLTSTFPSP